MGLWRGFSAGSLAGKVSPSLIIPKIFTESRASRHWPDRAGAPSSVGEQALPQEGTPSWGDRRGESEKWFQMGYDQEGGPSG